MLADGYGDTALSYLLKLDSQGNEAYTWGTNMIEVGGKNLCLIKDQNGDNPMHLAVRGCNHPYLFDVLLAAGGADLVLDENRDGYTPLHYVLWIERNHQKIPTNILRGVMSNGGADYRMTYPYMQDSYARRPTLIFYVHFANSTLLESGSYPRNLDVIENIGIMSDAAMQSQPGTLGRLLETFGDFTILQWAINFGIYRTHKHSLPSEKVEGWKMILSIVESELFQDTCFTFDAVTNMYPIASLALAVRCEKDLLSILYCVIRLDPSRLLSITIY